MTQFECEMLRMYAELDKLKDKLRKTLLEGRMTRETIQKSILMCENSIL